jgi:hypothetical protein
MGAAELATKVLDKADSLVSAANLRDEIIDLTDTENDSQRFRDGWDAIVKLGKVLGIDPTGAVSGGKLPKHIPENLKPIIKLAFEDPKKTEELAKTLAQFPEDAKKFGAQIAASAADGKSTIDPAKAFKLALDNTQTIKAALLLKQGAEQFLKDHPEAQSLVPAAPAIDFAKVLSDPKEFEATRKQLGESAMKLYAVQQLADKKPELFKRAVDLGVNFNQFKKDHALISSLADGQDLGSLLNVDTRDDKKAEEFFKNTEALVAKNETLLKTLQTSPKTLATFEQMLAKYPVKDGKIQLPAGDGLAAQFQDPAKLQAFVKESEQFLTEHPALGELLVAKFDPKDPNNKQASDSFLQLFNKPENLKKLSAMLKENPDAELFLTGKFDFGAVMSDPAAFFQRNPTLLASMNDPLTAGLLANSDFAKNFPEVYAKIKDGTAESMLTMLGWQKPKPIDPNASPEEQQREREKNDPMKLLMNALAKGDFATIIIAACALLFGGMSGNSAQLAGQQQAQGASRG